MPHRFFLFLFIFSSLFIFSPTLAQTQHEVSGQVTNKAGQMLPGVSVNIKNTSLGTATDVNGNYKLTVNDDVQTLVFSSVGFATHEVSIAGQSVVNVQLEEGISDLGEVVVSIEQSGRLLP